MNQIWHDGCGLRMELEHGGSQLGGRSRRTAQLRLLLLLLLDNGLFVLLLCLILVDLLLGLRLGLIRLLLLSLLLLLGDSNGRQQNGWLLRLDQLIRLLLWLKVLGLISARNCRSCDQLLVEVHVQLRIGSAGSDGDGFLRLPNTEPALR